MTVSNAKILADAEALAANALAHLAADEDRFSQFCALTGVAPADVAILAGDRAFLLGVLEHLLRFEPSLMECAASLEIEPERFGQAALILGGDRPSW